MNHSKVRGRHENPSVPCTGIRLPFEQMSCLYLNVYYACTCVSIYVCMRVYIDINYAQVGWIRNYHRDKCRTEGVKTR